MPLAPADITKLAVGPARVLYAPTSVAVPKKLQDIVKLTESDDYAPVTGWIDFGAAPEGDGASYSRGFETESLGIEQSSGAVFTDITDVNRSFSLNVAEISPENMKIVEGTTIANEVVAATGTTASQVRVPIGSVSEFPSYRVALIGQRKRDSGLVIEPDGTERGVLIGVVLNRCTITADDSEIEVAKGSLMSAPLQFEGFPEPGLKKDEAFGGWIFEDAADLGSGS
jgi:hypothetical protein